jgi:hypothetical protein
VGGEVIVAERVGQEERGVMMMCLSSVTQLMEASLMVVETGPPAKTNKGTVLLQLMVLPMVKFSFRCPEFQKIYTVRSYFGYWSKPNFK